MTGLPIGPGIALAVLLALATLVGARLMARRAARAVEIRVVGEVPPVSDWIPAVLQQFAGQSGAGSTAQFEDELDGPILNGHRGLVSVPAADTVLALRMQPHGVLADRPASYPVVIIVELTQFPRRTGFSRLVYGSGASASALALRSRLADAIARSARDGGLSVRTVRHSSGGALVAAGAVLVALALLATLIPTAIRLGGELTTPSSAPPWFPAAATECPAPSKPPAKPPTRTAVAKGTSCSFAEVVRRAYAKAKVSGSTVKLGKLPYDKKTKLTVTCKVGPPIVCTGGKKQVYLN